jgi:hypothetical protein
MKTLTNLALAAAILTSTVAAQADWVQGHFRANGTYVAPYYRTPANGNPYDNLSYRTPAPRLVSPSLMPSYGSSKLTPRTLPNTGQSYGSSGYVYRNPYAAIPSVSVSGYSRTSGTFVAPHVRTPANHTVTDNLSYRGFGTIKVPRY